MSNEILAADKTKDRAAQLRGGLIVVSAPSGTGKSTVLSRVMEEVENLAYSISYTTRQPRRGEQDGKDYFFVSVEEFQRMRERGEFLESAVVHGNFYGTSHRYIENELQRGRNILLDIDVQGAKMIRQVMPDAALVFIMPPSFEQLEHRLRTRGSDSDEVIAQRLANARDEVLHYRDYHYVVVNDDLECSVRALMSIIEAERYRWRRSEPSIRNIVSTFGGE